MNRDLFNQRLQAGTLSLWELGSMLGVHPHHLHGHDTSGGLVDQPVRVVIDLARQLDMHPADLVPGMETVLANRRAPAADEPDTGPDDDALVVLVALAATSVPLNVEDLATALGWVLDRAAAALEYAGAHPHLGGPVALRRVPPHGWTVTPRRDILTTEQRTALAETVRYHRTLTADEATALLAALAIGHTPEYTSWRQGHLDAEHSLKASGLLHSENGPHRVQVAADVRYSLDRSVDPR